MALEIELMQDDRTWVLGLSGELDYSECSSFSSYIDRILKDGPPAAIVDLSGLEYLDSSGLGLLLRLSKEYGSQGGRLVIVTNETVDNILSLTRLDAIFSIAGNTTEARQLIEEALS
ncbi:MAG: hypothetical protein Kow0056_16620 [Coriobacteriia bacterium]